MTSAIRAVGLPVVRHDCIDDFLFHELCEPGRIVVEVSLYALRPFRGERGTERSRRRGARRGRRHAARRELLDQYLELDDGEKAILAGVVEGRPNKQIAGDISCCERTVKDRRSRMMRKFAVRARSSSWCGPGGNCNARSMTGRACGISTALRRPLRQTDEGRPRRLSMKHLVLSSSTSWRCSSSMTLVSVAHAQTRNAGWEMGADLVYQTSHDINFNGGSHAELDDDLGIAGDVRLSPQRPVRAAVQTSTGRT